MHDALEKTGRDIVYSISNGALFGLAPAFAEFAQCWRTTGDITDTCKRVSGIGFREQDRWAMLASPMLLGCDMSKLDDFTISLLCNSEVIDIHQDVLGYQASKYY